jgi:hypothetical protein
MAPKSFHAFVLGGTLLVSLPMTLSAQVANQEGSRSPRPVGFDVAYEWQYSCPEAKGCSFTCPGSGGATNVTKLSLYLGSLPLARTENTAGIFYDFSSRHVPQGNGFAITTGISTLSCQVQGMHLDYSGPGDKTKVSEDIPTASITKPTRP